MRNPRSPLTLRVVPLTASGDNNLAHSTTAVERLVLVEALTREGWSLAGRQLPTYTRAETPVVVIPMTTAMRRA
jgi:hypothetical protein